MAGRFRSVLPWIGLALATPPPRKNERSVPSGMIWLAAAGIAGAFFTYKLACYRGLANTSDLFQFAQLATTWLHGHFLTDNCYGSHLSIHTYFFCPLLALVVVPWGVPGLLVALSLALAAGFLAMVRIQRLFGIPAAWAGPWAALVTLMPLSLHAYQDLVYGFHIELLMPAMALWLVYFLLRRNGIGTAAMTLLLLSVKEEAPLLVAACGAMVLCEDLLRGLQRAPAGQPPGRINLPALGTIVAAGIALPLLLHILRAHPATGYSLGSFQRIRTVDGTQVSGRNSLTLYVLHNLPGWMGSEAVGTWLGVAVIATFGLIALRPHFLVIGLMTTLVAWLIQDDLMWAPRFAPPLAFFQIVATLGFISLWRLLHEAGHGRSTRRWVFRLAGAGALAGAALVVRAQLQRVPDAVDVYRLRPTLTLSPADRHRADALFAIYEHQRKPGEAAIASPYLFRYVAYPDLYWWTRLDGRPTPIWYLRDYGHDPIPTETRPAFAPQDYRLVAEDGRFLLYKLKSAGP